jgi:Methane/Phenol/Toluene Hydroxylase
MRLVALDADSAAMVGLARSHTGPLRFPGHGLQMLAAYIGKMAPSSRITMAASFQAADEMRSV